MTGLLELIRNCVESRASWTVTTALPPLPSPLPCTPLPTLRRTLADIIMEKLTEKQTEVETVMSEVTGFPMPQLDPRVLEVYRGVREVRAGIPLHLRFWVPTSHTQKAWWSRTILSQSVWVQSPAAPLSDLVAVGKISGSPSGK